MSLMNGFRWSFSKLETAASCPFAFKKLYLDHKKPEPNPFAQLGTLCHDLLAAYTNGRLAAFDLLPCFEKRYPREVTAQWPAFPVALEDRTREKVAFYFRHFSSLPFTRFLMVEEKLIGSVAGHPFSGILDLVAETSDGRIVIVDHKSSGMSEYRGRRLAHHLRQLFLYAHLLKQCCSIQTDAVAFNLFKEGQWIELPWSQRQEDEAISWAAGMTAAMESLICAYFQKLTLQQQSLQQLLLQKLPAKEIRTQLHLSPCRLNRLMREMDEVALMVLGQKETSGDYGCQHICSARSYCDEGGVS